MQITKIAVRVGCTVSTGNYENARIEMEVEATIDLNESQEEATARLWDYAKRSVGAEARAIRAKTNGRQAEEKDEPNPGSNPRPKTLGDLVTPKQLWMLRSLATEAGFNPEQECLNLLQCPLEEISKRAASSLIDQFRQKADTAPV